MIYANLVPVKLIRRDGFPGEIVVRAGVYIVPPMRPLILLYRYALDRYAKALDCKVKDLDAVNLVEPHLKSFWYEGKHLGFEPENHELYNTEQQNRAERAYAEHLKRKTDGASTEHS